MEYHGYCGIPLDADLDDEWECQEPLYDDEDLDNDTWDDEEQE